MHGFDPKDTGLVGIDFRVQDGKLYGVGDGGGIYTIDTKTAEAKRVSFLTETLNGKFFGVDFNPAADRLRIISDTGQNLAHNLNRWDNGRQYGAQLSGTGQHQPRDRRYRRRLHEQ